jgi:hypothetical protein
MMLWSSTAVRSYLRGTRSFTPADLPPSLAGRLQDTDNNGIPDSIENMSTADLKTAYSSMGNQTNMTNGSLVNTSVDTSG